MKYRWLHKAEGGEVKERLERPAEHVNRVLARLEQITLELEETPNNEETHSEGIILIGDYIATINRLDMEENVSEEIRRFDERFKRIMEKLNLIYQ